ncbi:MAG: hypothetical protein ACE37F_35815 [Nannocystaceae bacterium]|nr:hypothetical protein [bacterium]
MPTLTQATEDAYEEFLVEIDMLLDDLGELLRRSSACEGQRVAYDPDSLDAIERFYLGVLAGTDTVTVSPARMNRIMAAFYGEAVRERAGGTWELCNNPHDIGFGLPVVADWGEGVLAFSPVEVRDAQIRERKPVIRETVEYCENKEQIEADFFKEFE